MNLFDLLQHQSGRRVSSEWGIRPPLRIAGVGGRRARRDGRTQNRERRCGPHIGPATAGRPASRPSHLLGLVHTTIDREVRCALRNRSPDAQTGTISFGVIDESAALVAEIAVNWARRRVSRSGRPAATRHKAARAAALLSCLLLSRALLSTRRSFRPIARTRGLGRPLPAGKRSLPASDQRRTTPTLPQSCNDGPPNLHH
jgi:hypothetical protein